MMNRREALARLGSMMATGWLASNTVFGAEVTTGAAATTSTAGAISLPDASRGKPFTVAHITDVHVHEKLGAPKWFAESLHHVQSSAAKPSFIINTGDCVLDTLSTDRVRADMLWKIWRDILTNENSLPIHHCLGNHDVWGLDLDKNHPAKKDPSYGFDLALKNLGMERPYYSFDHGDWHFVVLNSIFPTGLKKHAGWIAKLDSEQFQWLKDDLEATPADRHVAVYSHIPILSVTTMLSQEPVESDGGYKISPYIVMSDARSIIDLFAKHPNVKLCLSGHMHLLDRIELAGVTYICDGAVSGRWWRGARMNCPPGYSTIDFKPDGKFDYNYTTYGWEPDALA